MTHVSADHIQVRFERIAADVFKVLAHKRQTLPSTRHFVDLRHSCGETTVRGRIEPKRLSEWRGDGYYSGGGVVGYFEFWACSKA